MDGVDDERGAQHDKLLCENASPALKPHFSEEKKAGVRMHDA